MIEESAESHVDKARKHTIFRLTKQVVRTSNYYFFGKIFIRSKLKVYLLPRHLTSFETDIMSQILEAFMNMTMDKNEAES